MKTKGFTLIELMIVIAIVSIIATIAITNFQDKKGNNSSSSSSSCSDCSSTTQSNSRLADRSEFDEVKFDGPRTTVYRVHDHKKNVTCWIVGSGMNGISCIPDQLINPIGVQ